MSNSHVTLNPQKTQSCIYIKKKPYDYNSLTFLLKDTKIILTSTFKYLGLVFDNKFHWAAHLRSLQQKSKMLVHIMS